MTTPRALDPAEKQPQDFTHSAVVQQLLFGSDATEGEDTELQCGRKIKRKNRSIQGGFDFSEQMFAFLTLFDRTQRPVRGGIVCQIT